MKNEEKRRDENEEKGKMKNDEKDLSFFESATLFRQRKRL